MKQNYTLILGMHAYNPSTQKDSWEFRDSLNYTVSLKSTWAISLETISHKERKGRGKKGMEGN